MNNGSIATRYARALFEEARSQFIDHEVYEHLGMLHSNMKAEPELQSVLISPRISKEKKFKLLVTASGVNAGVWLKEHTVPKVESYDNTLYTRFLQLVLEHGRESYLRTIIFVYRDLYREHYEIDRVVFETAAPMDDDTLQKVTQKVASKTGRKVELVTSVRPEIIGGFRIRIGDVRYDYSYQTKLANIRKRLWNK